MKSPKKIMLAFGTRPEAIKMAPLCHSLKALPAEFLPMICVTAQHRQMLDQVMRVFNIAPDIDLNLMKAGQDLFDVTAAVLLGMRDVLREHRPDVLLIHGDTTTTLAAAIAGYYADVPVGHVEAGLRTRNVRAPFPEEFNRQTVSKITRWHFAPTQLSMKNLVDEGVPAAHICVTGNTVIDALLLVLNQIDGDPVKKQEVVRLLSACLPFDWEHNRFVLITGHRRENFGDGFLQICEALKVLAKRFSKVNFVYPVHLNPNVQNPVNAILNSLSNVHLIEPLDYAPFVYLLRCSHVVLTDSGGIQEEAPSLGKPVLVMRDVTERPEAVEAGTVRLVGANRERIVSNLSDLLENEESYRSMTRAHNPYGDGNACKRIIDVMKTI